MKVYIGYDEREAPAAEVAAKSLRAVSGIEAEFLCRSKLRSQGLLWRPTDERGGQDYDITSNTLQSTQFKFSRFLVPLLCQQRFALFVDCDVLFCRDPREMLDSIESRNAVNVVQHNSVTTLPTKMGNLRQLPYDRKWWSSVMLFNCDHPANRRLTLHDVNERTGEELHRFYWLANSEIGSLGTEWNWLVDVQKMPASLGIAHMTLGGPWLEGWQGGSFDSEWKAARER